MVNIVDGVDADALPRMRPIDARKKYLQGTLRYFIGNVCKKGHTPAIRMAQNGNCRECQKAKNARAWARREGERDPRTTNYNKPSKERDILKSIGW